MNTNLNYLTTSIISLTCSGYSGGSSGPFSFSSSSYGSIDPDVPFTMLICVPFFNSFSINVPLTSLRLLLPNDGSDLPVPLEQYAYNKNILVMKQIKYV